jgi:D-alanyl-lipoteichoic acid acyltransferase DltB (MBOAT superfamily)
LVFLPLALLVFQLIPQRWPVGRKLWLAAASFIFYGYWKIDYIPLLVFSILFNYGIAEWMFREHGRRRSGWILSLGVAVNLGLLGYYKYADFFINTFNAVARSEVGLLELILPLAISFFTFTQIAYLVDVYRDQAKHYSFLDYSLFVVFFPHLIAGPIVRRMTHGGRPCTSRYVRDTYSPTIATAAVWTAATKATTAVIAASEMPAWDGPNQVAVVATAAAVPPVTASSPAGDRRTPFSCALYS